MFSTVSCAELGPASSVGLPNPTPLTPRTSGDKAEPVDCGYDPYPLPAHPEEFWKPGSHTQCFSKDLCFWTKEKLGRLEKKKSKQKVIFFPGVTVTGELFYLPKSEW